MSLTLWPTSQPLGRCSQTQLLSRSWAGLRLPGWGADCRGLITGSYFLRSHQPFLHLTEGSLSGGCRLGQRGVCWVSGPGLCGFLIVIFPGCFWVLGTECLACMNLKTPPPTPQQSSQQAQRAHLHTRHPRQDPRPFPLEGRDNWALAAGLAGNRCPRTGASCPLPTSSCLLSWFAGNPWPATRQTMYLFIFQAFSGACKADCIYLCPQDFQEGSVKINEAADWNRV